MTNQKSKIFLSYAREDMGMAKRLYDDLKRFGLNIWFDQESILGGQNWKVEVKKAIRKSNYFLVILSKNSVSHEGYVQKEIRIALEKQELRSESKIFIIPVRIEKCEPDYEKLYDLNWIDLFPENEYQNGLRKILQVVSPGTFVIRNEPKELSTTDVQEMLKMHGYYEIDRNPAGNGIKHHYKVQEVNGDKIVIDEATGLIWQQSGSDEFMKFEDGNNWIVELNQNGYAGYHDWRLPTLEEAMSLMEPSLKKANLYIDAVFDELQTYIWTADLVKGEWRQWVVTFEGGSCDDGPFNYLGLSYVRAVRSG